MYVIKGNLKINIESLGEIEFRTISSKDWYLILEILHKHIPQKNLVLDVLFHQCASPSMKYEEFQNIPNLEIERIAKAFLENEEYIYKNFTDTGMFFQDFIDSFKTTYEKLNIDIESKNNKYAKLIKERSGESLLKKVYDATKNASYSMVQELAKSPSIQQELGLNTNSLMQMQKDIYNYAIFNDFSILHQALLNFSQNEINLFEAELREYKEAKKHYHNNIENIAKEVQPAIEEVKRFTPFLEEVQRHYQNTIWDLAENLQPMIESLQKLTPIYENYYTLWDALQKKYQISERTAAKVLRKYKWFITPSFPTSFIYKIVQLDNKKGRQDKAVNECFVEYFQANNWRNLGKMVRSWENNNILKKRYKILLDCLASVRIISKKRKNEANVVLPTLITQIDGALSDYLKQKNIKWDYDYGFDKTDNATGKVIQKGRISQYINIKSQVLSNLFDNLANEIFLDVLFQNSQRGKPLSMPFNFNRHKIIHGESVKYGRRDYLIRAFMILDFIANLQ